MFPLLTLHSVHISIFSLVFVNCFRVFAISVGKGDTVCAEWREDGRRPRRTQEAQAGLGSEEGAGGALQWRQWVKRHPSQWTGLRAKVSQRGPETLGCYSKYHPARWGTWTDAKVEKERGEPGSRHP